VNKLRPISHVRSQIWWIQQQLAHDIITSEAAGSTEELTRRIAQQKEQLARLNADYPNWDRMYRKKEQQT
jgi:molecular chaperone GrpE (heat shock protein)